MTIKHLAYRVGHEFPGSVAGLASLMARGDVVLRNKLNPNSETHHLNIEEFEMMLDFANRNQDAAEYFAAKAGGVFMKVPDVPESDLGLLDLFMGTTKELGDVASAFQSAYADGNYTNKEYDALSVEVDEVIARLLEFKAGVKRVVR
ncbi:phage regulatory CII family protein [Methylotenera oryzisoli]|nr:phage regulatory CII family protein [Methylotenera oryzisoli]